MPVEVHLSSQILATNLKLARVARRLSQDEVGKAVGMNRAYIGGVEQAKRNPSLSTLDKLAAFFKCVPAQLLDLNFVPEKHFPPIVDGKVGYASASRQGHSQGVNTAGGTNEDATK